MPQPDFQAAVARYFQDLCGFDPHRDNEHSYRTQLENFLTAVCDAGITPRQEVKLGEPKLGVPDFSFTHDHSLGTVGLLENKAIGFNIDKLVNDPQVNKYRKRNENIILTNYLDWLLVKDGVVTHTATLGKSASLKRGGKPFLMMSEFIGERVSMENFAGNLAGPNRVCHALPAQRQQFSVCPERLKAELQTPPTGAEDRSELRL
jgi:hypothetical protein